MSELNPIENLVALIVSSQEGLQFGSGSLRKGRKLTRDEMNLILKGLGMLNRRAPIPEDGRYELIDSLELRLLRKRANTVMQSERGELWYWQGDGADFPETLGCPVVMSAETLRELLINCQAQAKPDTLDYLIQIIESRDGSFGGTIQWDKALDQIVKYFKSTALAMPKKPDLLPIIMRYCAPTMSMQDCRNMQADILEQFGLDLH